jgi:hypothetical protein
MRGSAATHAEPWVLAASADINALNINLARLDLSGVEFV